MLNFNDNMDDLIRQAADDYPLKTVGSDWGRVVNGMQQATKAEPLPNGKRYWWLLLLLPLIIAVPLFDGNIRLQKPAGFYNAKRTNTQEQSTILISGTTHQNVATTQGGIHNQTLKSSGKIKNEDGEMSSTDGTLFTSTARGSKADVPVKRYRYRNNSNNVANALKNKGITTPEANGLSNDSSKPFIGGSDDHTSTGLTESAITKSDVKNQKNSAELFTKQNDGKLTSSSKKDSIATAQQKNVIRTTPQKTKGWYVGAATALDVTSVKFNEVNKTGYSASIIAGYRINNKLSVESALMWDDKKYYSPGKYFNKSRTTIPDASYIHFLNGVCRMYEIPLDVKYDFNSRKLSGFYVAGGLSSYIMKKENYEYHATNNGNYYIGKREYKNSTKNVFSVANISGGYQLIFKNNSSLRFEPYAKVPLKGLGIGKLPFSSAGISAAYTLPLH